MVTAPTELHTLRDFVRYAMSRYAESHVVLAHGTTDPLADAAFLVCETLHLHPERYDHFADARVTSHEAIKLAAAIDARVRTRKPTAYLVNKAYLAGHPFFVDERVIVPRSFVAEILASHFSDETALVAPHEVGRVLELCTGSGCLAILAALHFEDATVDAVDLSPDALEVATRNVADYGLGDRVTLLQGDLYAPVGTTRYDLIISNPPYVDADGMAALPAECRHEPEMAFDGGDDGIALVRTIIESAALHLRDRGGLLCEIGRCRPALEAAYPDLPFLWLDTEGSQGEVFWLAAGDMRI